jgi:hypothetical protein
VIGGFSVIIVIERECLHHAGVKTRLTAAPGTGFLYFNSLKRNRFLSQENCDFRYY